MYEYLQRIQALEDEDVIRLPRIHPTTLTPTELMAIALNLASRLEREIELREFRLKLESMPGADAALARAAADWSGE